MSRIGRKPIPVPAGVKIQLTAASVEDVLHSIYRPRQKQPAVATHVTFSLDLLLFRPT